MEYYEIIIWSLCIGVSFAALYTYYVKKVLGSFIMALIAHEAFSPEKAITLDEAGSGKNLFVRFSLREGTNFGELFGFLIENEEKKYFLPEDKREKAEKKYNGEVFFYQVIVTIVLFVFIGFLLVSFFPDIMNLFQ